MYKYELHMHTSEGSACARNTGAEMVNFYIDMGYSGMVVTDHFYRGNTAPSREQPWREFIEAYAAGYRSAKKAAEERDFDVLFGIEVRGKGSDEYLVYGLSPEWYADHPELRDSIGPDFLAIVRGAGGFVIHAHPFRERAYMLKQTIRLYPDYVDAVEVRNCGNPYEIDRRALEYARELELPMTGGSDRHADTAPTSPLSGIALPFRCHTTEALIDALKNRQHRVLDMESVKATPLTEPTFTVKRA